jgi:hypothetical protein
MKKLLILILVLFLTSLSACSLNNSNEGEKKSDQINQSDIVGNDRDEHGCIGSAGYSWCEIKQKCLRVWEEKCEENTLNVNESISSEKLGIKVSYYSNPENKTGSKVEDNRVYFYMNGPENLSDYKSGQYLEGFTKKADISFQNAIENNFLKNINKDKCFVEIIEDTPSYQKAIINYPDISCPDGNPSFTCNVCPAEYSRTNGMAYFIYYKNNPNSYFYFSIGQYSLLAGDSQTSSNLEWFNNIEFLK